MNYKGCRGAVPPAGVCPGKMIVKFPPDSKFRGWPRDMDMCRCVCDRTANKKDLLNFSKSSNSYWVRESNPYCKIENLEY